MSQKTHTSLIPQLLPQALPGADLPLFTKSEQAIFDSLVDEAFDDAVLAALFPQR